MLPTETEAEAIHKDMVRVTDRDIVRTGSRDTADPTVSRVDIPKAADRVDTVAGGADSVHLAVLEASAVLIPAGESQRWGNDDLSVRLKGAANYVNNGNYNQAINALNSISQRDARWYYVQAMADSGLGNTSAALENATIAVQMDPDNMSYQSLYNSLRGGGAYYAGQGQRYGRGAGLNQTKFAAVFMTIMRI